MNKFQKELLKTRDELQKFGNELLDLNEKYEGKMPVYEMVHRMIAHAVSMSLCCAPDELLGIKTIIASVQNGIAEYEETHKKEGKNDT